jgi:oligogalacturonide lyase
MRFAALTCLILSGLSAVSLAQQPQSTVGRDLNTGASYAVRAPDNGQPPPKEWIDKDTGHRVVRLTDEPNSQSLYFNYNAYSPDGSKLTFTSPTGIYQIDLQTRQTELILPSTQPSDEAGKTVINNIIVVGHKTGRIFFNRTVVGDIKGQTLGYNASPDRGAAERSVWWIDPVTKEQHEIGTLPPNYNVATVNADETLLAGAVFYLDGRGGAATQPVRAAPGQRISLGARWAQHLPMALLTLNAQTGEMKTFNPSNDWDNHFQFSPTDPTLLMYCHEGPWQNNDRIWAIHTDGTGLFKVHMRTMVNEIWGHEWWAADGSTMWYQLQYPRGQGATGWIAGYNVNTGQRTWYLNAPNTGSIHVNSSKDGSLFAGDGGNGAPWIFLFRPHLARNMASGIYDSKGLIQPGWLEAERLVNMSNHEYALEPNVNFTPDMKWIVFRSNMFGPSYVFAVEVAKAQ